MRMDKTLTLPDFLKLLTSNNVPVSKAMAIASKVSVLVWLDAGVPLTQPRYSGYNTPALLAQLDDAKLQVLGVKDEDLCRLVLTAVRKAGYTRPTRKLKSESDSPVQPPAGSSNSNLKNSVQILVRSPFSCPSPTAQGYLAHIDYTKEKTQTR